MPAWASRMAKSTATIKSMAIKIRSVVADMAIPFYLRMNVLYQGRSPLWGMQGSGHWGAWAKQRAYNRVTRAQR